MNGKTGATFPAAALLFRQGHPFHTFPLFFMGMAKLLIIGTIGIVRKTHRLSFHFCKNAKLCCENIPAIRMPKWGILPNAGNCRAAIPLEFPDRNSFQIRREFQFGNSNSQFREIAIRGQTRNCSPAIRRGISRAREAVNSSASRWPAANPLRGKGAPRPDFRVGFFDSAPLGIASAGAGRIRPKI